MPFLRRPPSALAFLAVLICFACNSSDSRDLPASAASSQIRLAGADVLIDGHSVVGQSIDAGSGAATLFTASLVDPADADRIHLVTMGYPVHTTMGMTGGTATVSLHDDGMQCDPVAGDGHYCYLDENGHIGPHDADCPHGNYVYRFHGVDLLGDVTNSIECWVIVH